LPIKIFAPATRKNNIDEQLNATIYQKHAEASRITEKDKTFKMYRNLKKL